MFPIANLLNKIIYWLQRGSDFHDIFWFFQFFWQFQIRYTYLALSEYQPSFLVDFIKKDFNRNQSQL